MNGEVSLAKFGAYSGVDMSQYPLDEPFVFDGNTTSSNIITGVVNSVKAMFDKFDGPVTPRMFGVKMSLSGFAPVGTPEMVANAFEEQFNETDIDGFNIVRKFSP
jgi:alkanesulfonate monooxygenase SsuD/methylene tetrahydromethanopterin reductase-like flavin-dependent oxidoreductase (luciferase family)